jgi:6-phosphogluconolactonase (cycloisomerase 2 family)
VFRVLGPALALTQVATVDGSEPVAVAQHGNLVYVLNAGGSSAVVGFSLQHGRLERIANSRTFLSTNTSGPGSLAFSPDGRFLVVSEKSTNLIDVFPVNVDGTLGAIVKTPSADPGLFAVSFAPNGALIAAETGPAGGSNASTVASYAVQADGTLAAITTNLGTLGNANCWNAITPDGRFVYNSNAGSSNIAGFAIGSDGSLTALPGTVVGSNPAGSTNLDITVSADGKFLYTLNSHAGTIGVFAIHSDGTLSNVGEASGLTPLAGFNGIAAN